MPRVAARALPTTGPGAGVYLTDPPRLAPQSGHPPTAADGSLAICLLPNHTVFLQSRLKIESNLGSPFPPLLCCLNKFLEKFLSSLFFLKLLYLKHSPTAPRSD